MKFTNRYLTENIQHLKCSIHPSLTRLCSSACSSDGWFSWGSVYVIHLLLLPILLHIKITLSNITLYFMLPITNLFICWCLTRKKKTMIKYLKALKTYFVLHKHKMFLPGLEQFGYFRSKRVTTRVLLYLNHSMFLRLLILPQSIKSDQKQTRHSPREAAELFKVWNSQ